MIWFATLDSKGVDAEQAAAEFSRAFDDWSVQEAARRASGGSAGKRSIFNYGWTPPATATPTGANRITSPEPQDRADGRLWAANKKWERGDRAGAIADAEIALAILITLHGEQSNQAKKVREMIEAAKEIGQDPNAGSPFVPGLSPAPR